MYSRNKIHASFIKIHYFEQQRPDLTCKKYCCCQGIFVEGHGSWTTQPISYTPHSRGLVDQISKGSSKYQDILVRMHDTTISSIKKLVLVCLVTIMKWLVTLDAGLPAVVSLMTSTPCSLSQTWSSYRFCRLEQHDNMANRRKKLIRISCQYSPKFQNLGCRMLMVHHPSCSYWCTGSGREWSDHCLQPPQASLNTTHHPLPSAENDDDHHINEENVNDHDMHWLENISSSIHWWYWAIKGKKTKPTWVEFWNISPPFMKDFLPPLWIFWSLRFLWGQNENSALKPIWNGRLPTVGRANLIFPCLTQYLVRTANP